MSNDRKEKYKTPDWMFEKSEKPMSLETLEEDVKSWFFNEISSKINVEHTMYYYFQECARRYYELGRQSKPKACEGLEEEIDKFLNETGAPYCWCNDDEQKDWCTIIARHFAQWGAEHAKEELMKEAVPFYEILKAVPPGPERENVRIIIVKED